MRIDILTVMPGMCEAPLSLGMAAKARERGILDLHIVDLRDFTDDRHHTTDDYPFGGGPGMVMKPEPIGRAIDACRAAAPVADGNITRMSSPVPRVILMSPQGRRLDQSLVRTLAGEPHVVIICGRYEGVDERVRESLVDDEISIGDYVLTGGELPALVLVDGVMRFLPGVLGAEGGAEDDSFAHGLLEGPQYTRPREWRGQTVPEVLMSGDHARIAKWRRHMALRRTWQRRPDLLDVADLSPDDLAHLEELRRQS